MRQRRIDRHQILLAIRDAAVVLAPSHFGGVGAEISAGNAMMNADLSAADAREEQLGLVCAGLAVRIRPFVIDALGQEAGMQRIPMRRFVGMNR